MSRFVLGKEAQADLEEIWDHIAEDSIDAADRWAERLFRAFSLLAKNPGLGHKRSDLTSLPVLFWPVENYVIVYRADAGGMAIVAVTHGGRDVPALLTRR